MDAIKTWKERAAEHRTGLLRLPPQPEYFMAEEIADLRAALAIAPPVAAGSVDSIDTNEFCDLMTELQDVHQRLGNCKPNWGALIAHIHAWGAQQREAGAEEAASFAMAVLEEAQGLTQRAEKAEAELAALKAKIGDLHCKSCGTHEISLTKECHNSDCAEYANVQEVYAGWKF